MISPITAARTAFGWLTIAPVGGHHTTPDRRLGGAVIAAVPLVGAVLGAIVAAICLGLNHTHLPAPVIGVLAVAVLALSTRGMHLDGLADTADGLGCYGPPERVSEVMRSGTVGPFGVVTLVLVLGIEAVGIGALTAESRWYAIAFAIALVRLGAVIGARAGVPPAHPDGFGALVAGTQRRSVGVWSAIALAAGAISGFWGPTTHFDSRTAVAAVITVVVVGVVAWLFTAHCARRMGGINGDVLGATIELSVVIGILGQLV